MEILSQLDNPDDFITKAKEQTIITDICTGLEVSNPDARLLVSALYIKKFFEDDTIIDEANALISEISHENMINFKEKLQEWKTNDIVELKNDLSLMKQTTPESDSPRFKRGFELQDGLATIALEFFSK